MIRTFGLGPRAQKSIFSRLEWDLMSEIVGKTRKMFKKNNASDKMTVFGRFLGRWLTIPRQKRSPCVENFPIVSKNTSTMFPLRLFTRFVLFSCVFCAFSTFPTPLFSCAALPSPTHTCTHTRDSTQHATRYISSHHVTFDTCLVLILVVMASVSGQPIVVGGGLAGMSAANTNLENGGRVVLLDKSFSTGKSLFILRYGSERLTEPPHS